MARDGASSSGWAWPGRSPRRPTSSTCQAQSLERSTSTYAAFVRDAAAQARAANPRVTILAGLSTNPPGAEVTSQQLTDAIHATRGTVEGYWLNIPGRGPRCPTCNPPRPDVGRAALRAVL